MCSLSLDKKSQLRSKYTGSAKVTSFIADLEPVEVRKSQQEPLMGLSAEQPQLSVRQTQSAVVRQKIMTEVRGSAWSKQLRKSSWTTENTEQGVPVSRKHEESELQLLYFLTGFCKLNGWGFFQIVKIYMKTYCLEGTSFFNSSDSLEHFKKHRRKSSSLA